jgi:hypothetical protein
VYHLTGTLFIWIIKFFFRFAADDPPLEHLTRPDHLPSAATAAAPIKQCPNLGKWPAFYIFIIFLGNKNLFNKIYFLYYSGFFV